MTPNARTMAALPMLAVGMLSLAGAASAQAPLFEVESNDATKLLQVSQDAGFLVRGTFNAGAIPASGGGVRLMWYPGKAAFRAGVVDGDRWDDAKVGQWSMALGRNNTASGTHSLALNADTEASGDRSIAGGGGSTASGSFSLAMGQVAIASGSGAVALGIKSEATNVGSLAAGLEAKATGPHSTAVGEQTQATGFNTFAAGVRTVASGNGSTALGDLSKASGPNSLATGFQSQATGNVATAMGTGTIAAGGASVAMGTQVTAGGDGSFIFGDRSTNFPLTAAANTFMVRAFGGLGFNTGVNIGCDLPAGTGAWSCTSSRLAKEDFEDVDGEQVLAGLAGIRIQRWRYLGTDAVHLGPTAEDFRAAFGLGEGSTKIAAVDADGVALRSVQALERRTAALREENASLRSELDTLREELRALATRVPVR